MILEICFAAICGILLYGSAKLLRDIIFYRNLPPGPIPLPFVGTIYRVSKKIKPWKGHAKLAKEYGNIYTFYFGQMRVIFIHGAKNTRSSLVQHAKVFSDRPDDFMPGFHVLPKGIIGVDGQEWIDNRKFGLTGLRMFGVGKPAMTSKIQDEANHLIKSLDELRDGNCKSSLATMIQNNVFNIICCLIYGKRFELTDPNFVALTKASQILFERPFKENAIHMGLPFVTWFSTPPQAKDILNFSKVVKRQLLEIIEERKKQPKKQEVEDFVDLYIKKEKDISLSTCTGLLTDLFLAGTETTSSLLTWAIIYLCKWPEYQVKCQDAIDQVITSDRMPTIADRANLTYIDAFMNEIQRHVTVVPNSLFHAVKSENVKFLGYEIPPYSIICYNIWALHYDQDYWGDPDVFRPDRWIEHDGKLIDHSSHFMPFGLGPRICLGENLSKVEYFVFIVAMLQRFNFKFPSDDYDVDLDSGRYSVTHVPPPFDCVWSNRVA